MKIIVSVVSIIMMAVLAAAQALSPSPTPDKASLAGVTEAVLINGQPVLRIVTRKGGVSQVVLQKRDGEDCLVFKALRDSFRWPPGTLYVSRTKVIFDPDEKKSKYFNLDKSLVKNVELQNNPTAKVVIQTSAQSEGLMLDYTFLEITADAKYVLPGHNFLKRAILDFDGALAEFNQLTEFVRSKPDDEDLAEDAAPGISDRYDRFKDATFVSTSKMRLTGKRAIRAWAEYEYPGKDPQSPAGVLLYFHASASRAVFPEDELQLNFMVDDQRLPLGLAKLKSEEKTASRVIQVLAVTIPYNTFIQIASGKKAEFQIGSLEFRFSDVHLETLRKFIAYKPEK